MKSFIIESADEYNLREGVRASILKEILRSPAHAREMMSNPKPPTIAMELGTLVHSAILEPDVFEKYVVAPKFDRRTTVGKAAAKDFEEANSDRVQVDEETFQIVGGCLESVYSHPIAKELLSQGRCEMTVTWEEDGLKCKARPDVYQPGILIDVKTTRDASPQGFARQVASLKYHLQAAHYLKGVSAVSGLHHETFIFVAVETTPPFAVGVYQLDFGSLERGEYLWRQAIDRYRQCLTLDEWPAYSNEIQSLGLPAWAFGDLEEE